MITRVQTLIQTPMRYVHVREIPKVLTEDLIALQQPGILPWDCATCRCNAIPFIASDWSAIAMVFLKNGIIKEE
jgi:hypothetical protein